MAQAPQLRKFVRTHWLQKVWNRSRVDNALQDAQAYAGPDNGHEPRGGHSSTGDDDLFACIHGSEEL